LIENAFAGIVLTAQSFNPSIFTESWLSANKIIAPESLVGVRVFAPQIAQLQTKEVQVQVIPPQMQVTFSIHGVTAPSEVARNIVARTVELLPHTPYRALGLNFNYFIAEPDGQDFSAYDRSLLGTGNNQLLMEFSGRDAKFGRYFSKDYGDARLRLDIKPVKAGPKNRDLLQFSFNFHYDVMQVDQSKRAQKVIELTNTWDSLRKYAEQLLELGSTAKS
jgi:hypothetical protein